MSFPRYPSYNDSGVAWLGEVPGHWEVRPLKRLARLQTGMTPPTDEWDNYIDDEGFQWIRPEDIDETGAPTKSSKFLTEKGWSQTRQIKAGASLICCIGTIGKVGITTDAVSTNQQITAAEPQQDARYLFYAICAGRSELELASTGNVLRILNTERLGNIRFTNPPLPEQVQITAFLDRETAKIDALVTEQRRLMDLLKEKRQAVIFHAVTRGLNADAPMKPSGIEWLGAVPAHWRVVPLGRVTVSRCDGPFGSGLKSEHYTDSGVRVIRLQNIRRDGFNGLDEAFIGAEYYKSELSGHDVVNGDVLIAGLGDDKNTVGRACVAPLGIEPAMVKADCFRYRLDITQALPDFVATALSASSASDAGVLSTGSTRSRIPLSVMATRKLAMPPLIEQLEIAAFLKVKSDGFDMLISEAQRAIDLLQERRTTLISAAVTGQIDVRGATESL